jgi:hypothetical protein
MNFSHLMRCFHLLICPSIRGVHLCPNPDELLVELRDWSLQTPTSLVMTKRANNDHSNQIDALPRNPQLEGCVESHSGSLQGPDKIIGLGDDGSPRWGSAVRVVLGTKKRVLMALHRYRLRSSRNWTSFVSVNAQTRALYMFRNCSCSNPHRAQLSVGSKLSLSL